MVMQQIKSQTVPPHQSNSPYRFIDLGLLLLRLGIGAMFIAHGWPKLKGGPELWEKIGQAMGNFGMDMWPTFWGLLATISEFGGGLLLMLGLFFRPACFLLLCTMIAAATAHFSRGDSFGEASHAIEAGILFLSLLLIGPGKYALSLRFRKSTSPKA